MMPLLDPAVRAALDDLVDRYAAYTDDRRLDDVAQLFAEDATLVVADPPKSLDPARELQGRAAIRSGLAALDRVEVTVHRVTGRVYDLLDDGSVAGRVSGTAHHMSAGRDAAWFIRYEDRYRFDGDRWRFARRVLRIEAVTIGDIARHRSTL